MLCRLLLVLLFLVASSCPPGNSATESANFVDIVDAVWLFLGDELIEMAAER